MTQRWIIGSLVLLALGCGGPPPAYHEPAPAPRRMTVWLDRTGLDVATAERLRLAGVDGVVVRRGTADLRGQAPVLRIEPAPPVEGAIPTGIAIEISGVRPGLDAATAEAVWRALATELDGAIPAEIVLDLPQLADGIEAFIVALRDVSGVAVVPLLSFEQLRDARGRAAALAAGSCVVPAFGTDGAGLRGIGERDPLPLAAKLEPLADAAIRVRVAVSLNPRTEPPLERPGDSLDALTERAAATVSTSSALDRSFRFERAVTWSGRQWSAGDSLAVRWIDASRLRSAIDESHRLLLPELGGWDLVTLPVPGEALGLNREELLRFLGGEGPQPDVELRVERDGRTLQVVLVNPTVFSSAVSNHGNWVQVAVGEGWLKADEAGSFERLERGTLNNGSWEQGSYERVNAVRFFETYLAPGERLVSGRVQVPSASSRVSVQWHLSLADGEEVSGGLER
jgi:hypothetical protein